MAVDFTSSLYLGLGHPRDALDDWPQLTTGGPAVLGEPPIASRVAQEIAQLVGCERAVVSASTLHIAWDLGEWIHAMHADVLVDHSAYPTLRAAAQLARGRGSVVRRIRGHDPAAMHEALRRLGAPRGPVVVITDGFCPVCRRVAPIARYAQAASATGGFVVVDDTQSLGVLGTNSTIARPYGRGGSGSLAWVCAPRDNVVVVASLAKAFGAPMAALASSGENVARFVASSMTRTHCSPPSFAALHAGARALRINRVSGDALRARLCAVVRYFRGRMAAVGAHLEPGLFPVQVLRTPRGAAAVALQHQLARAGARAAVTGSSDGRGRGRARLVFVLTTRHTAADIDRTAAAMASANLLSPLPAEAPCNKSGNRAPSPSPSSARFHSSTSAK